MKLIIAGSRNYHDYGRLTVALGCYFAVGHLRPTEVVSGAAPGADALGERWAITMDIPVRRFPADCEKHGRSAGPQRNQTMALYADGLLSLWDGQSPGSRHMISCMRALKKPVFVYRIDRSLDQAFIQGDLT